MKKDDCFHSAPQFTNGAQAGRQENVAEYINVLGWVAVEVKQCSSIRVLLIEIKHGHIYALQSLRTFHL